MDLCVHTVNSPKIERVKVSIDDVKVTTITIELWHTIQQWKDKYASNENLWSFSVEDALTGAIELSSDTLYWYIDGRIYETDIEL